jgi:UPF0755 protein
MRADAGKSSSHGNGAGAPVAANAAHRYAADRLSPRSPRTALEPEVVPEPKRASRRARNPFVVVGSAFFTLVLLVAVVAAFGASVGRQRFEAAGPLDADKIVNVPRGSGLRDIADLLQREGVIGAGWMQNAVFIGGVVVRKAQSELKAGEYEFHRQSSVAEVLNTLVEGKVILHAVTIPEGLTSEQVIARLMENETLTGNIREIPKEGSLLPETYNFNRGATRELLVQQMQQKQRDLVEKIWERRANDLPIKTPEQLVVLASIIEKETGKPDERTRVAAVFVNRLKQHMRLQSDPTIIYGLVGGKGTLGRPIMRSEIEQSTPYNTYMIDGLPPGPIANPGRASLEAAATPARTKELYFVADGTGGHAFSESFDQHQKSVTHLRQLERGEVAKDVPDAPAFAAVPRQGAANAATTAGRPSGTAGAAPRSGHAQRAEQAKPRANSQRPATGQSAPPQ